MLWLEGDYITLNMYGTCTCSDASLLKLTEMVGWGQQQIINTHGTHTHTHTYTPHREANEGKGKGRQGKGWRAEWMGGGKRVDRRTCMLEGALGYTREPLKQKKCEALMHHWSTEALLDCRPGAGGGGGGEEWGG